MLNVLLRDWDRGAEVYGGYRHRADWASPTRQGYHTAFLKWCGAPSTGTTPLIWLLQVTLNTSGGSQGMSAKRV